jgi:tape measure domain-containing protein
MSEIIAARIKIEGQEEAIEAVAKIDEQLKRAEDHARKAEASQKKLNEEKEKELGLVQKLKTRLTELEEKRFYAKSAKEVRSLNQEIKKTQDEMDKLTSVSNRAGSNLVAVFKSGAAAFGGFLVGQSIANTIGNAFEGLLNKEKISASFEILVGNTERARASLAQLVDFARTTPFELPQITEAAKKLLAFGFSAEELEPRLRTLGDLAAGLDIPITDLAAIFGKASIQGRLFAEDLNQIVDRGIPVLEPLAARLGVTVEELRKKVEEGAVSFRDLDAVFLQLTTNGGRFEGMTQKLSQTLGGRLSTLKDEISASLIQALENALPLIELVLGSVKILVEGFGSLVGAFSNFNATVKENIPLVSSLGVAMGLLTIARLEAIKATTAQTTADILLTGTKQRLTAVARALRLELLLNPYVAVAAAVVALGAAFNEWLQWNQKIDYSTKNLRKETDALAQDIQAKAVAAAQEEITKLAALVDATKNTTLSIEERRKALNQLQTLYPEYFKNQSIENLNVQALSASYEKLSKTIIESAKSRILSEKLKASFEGTQKSILELQSQITESRKTGQEGSVWDFLKSDKDVQKSLEENAKIPATLRKFEEAYNKASIAAQKYAAATSAGNEKVIEAERKKLKAASENLLQASQALQRTNAGFAAIGELDKKIDEAAKAGKEYGITLQLVAESKGKVNFLTEKAQSAFTATAAAVANANKAYEGIKVTLNEVGKALENISAKNQKALADLKTLEAQKNAKTKLEELFIGNKKEREDSLAEIENAFQEMTENAAKNYKEALEKIQEERKKVKSAEFKGDVNQALQVLAQQEKQLQQKALENEIEIKKQYDAARASAAILSEEKFRVQLNDLAQETAKEISEKGAKSLQEVYRNINDTLKVIASGSNLDQVKAFYNGLLDAALSPIDAKLIQVRAKLNDPELQKALTSPDVNVFEAALALKEKYIQEELELETEKIQERTRIQMESVAMQEKIAQEELRIIENKIYREKEALRDILQTAFTRTGNINVDAISSSLFTLAENVFDFVGLFQTQKNREIEILRKAELEKQRIMRESVQEMIKIAMKDPSRSKEDIEQLKISLQGLSNLSFDPTNLKDFSSAFADFANLQPQEKTKAIGQLVSSTLESGFQMAKTFQNIEAQSLARSIEFQQRQVEESRRIADKGNAEMLQENLKVMDELQKQQQEQAEARINLALAEMAAKSLVAIATAAAQGGVAAAVTIPIVIASMLAGFAVMKEQAKAQGAAIRGGFRKGGYTGDKPVDQVAGYVHGKEFVFDADTTRKHRNIFEKIHKGHLDLSLELGKAKILDQLMQNRLYFRNDLPQFFTPQTPPAESNAIAERLERLERVIREQERLKVEISEKGIYAIVNRIAYDQKRAKAIAK